MKSHSLVPAALLGCMLLAGPLGASIFSDAMKAYKSGRYAEAKSLYEEALDEDGALQAHYFLGLLYLKGKGTPKNLSLARKHLTKAANSGNARAKCFLGEIWLQFKNIKKAKKLLKEGARSGAQECRKIAKQYKISIERGR